jgi:hypothetical protein
MISVMRYLGLQSSVVNEPDIGYFAERPASAALDRSDAAKVVEESQVSLEPTAEQTHYADILEKGARFGLLCLFITFPLYIFDIVPPHTPLQKVSDDWALDAEHYCAATHIHVGWGWVSMLGKGDFLNFVGITILAGVTAACYLGMIPQLLKRKDLIYTVLVLLQLAVLALAASGILAVGH